MSTCNALLTCVLTIYVSAGGAMGADGDDALLRHEVAQHLDAFRALTAQAASHGIDVARERVTITTAELFLEYADWDRQHPDELQTAIGSWWRARDQAEQIGRELPERELREILEILDAASRELAAVIERPASRRSVPPIDSSALELDDGYFQFDGRPVFPSSFVWMPDDEKLTDAYGDIGGTFIHPPNLLPDGAGARVRYEPKGPGESMGYVFLGHKNMPRWVVEKHPDIKVGERHFTAYDIDHPATREVWQALLAEAVPQFAGRKVSQGGYMLANEPHWFSATDEWATGPVSGYTAAKFRAWLEERHETINALNELWGKEFASFEAVSLEVPVDAALVGTPIWYDWCRFNMHRVTDWFTFLKGEIQRHDPEGRTHIKLIPGQFAGGSRSHGLDFETLVRLQEIIGCDAQVTRTKSWRDKGDWDQRYACFWRNLSMPYDFFRSVSPDKLLFDSEFHGLSTVHWRDPDMPPEYVRCIYWLAHLHGMGMNQTWYWSRDADGVPKTQSQSGFHASNLTMPRVMDAFGRTMKELNAFAPELVSLATEPKPIRLFYSETSAIQDAAYMDHVYESYKALYHEGTPLGFVTERMLTEAADAELVGWPVVVVTRANYVTAAEREALARYVSQGGTLIIVGAESLAGDEYGRPHDAELAMNSGQILRIGDVEPLPELVGDALRRASVSPPVRLTETNTVGLSGCVWRTASWEDGYLVLILNLGRSEAEIDVGTQTPCRDMLTSTEHPAMFTMKPFDVKLLHVRQPLAVGSESSSGAEQTSVYPFSDTENRGGWVLNNELSDEFDGTELDDSKWFVQGTDGGYYIWRGRAPSQFAPHNVRVEDDRLKLRSQWEPDFSFHDEAFKGYQYENITTAGVISRKRFLYGYMEIKSKAGDAAMTSSFWALGYQSELDVFEQMGRPKNAHQSGFANTYMFSIHDWRPGAPEQNTVFTHRHKLDYRVADDFHVYGCEWGIDYLKFYEDGNLVRSVTQEELGDAWLLTNPLEIWFDSETFPWMGLPEKEDLPVDFEIEYVRVWQKPVPNLLDRAFFSFEGPILLEDVPKPKREEKHQQYWYIGKESSPHFAIVDEKFASGRKSLEFTQRGKLSAAKVAVMAPYGAVDIPAGEFMLSMKIWLEPGGTVERIRPILDSPWLEVTAIDLTDVARGEWVTVSQTFSRNMASADKDRLRLVIHEDDAPESDSTLYIDDISITTVTRNGGGP